MSTNLSKIKRDKMLQTISKIKENIEDDETLKNLSLIEYELTKKKYGLVWEEHEERVDEELKTQIPTFEEVKEKEIVSNESDKFNFLLEGDNLHSLYLLEKTHKEKIDVIYIDPPYNTGNNDFIYGDNYVESEDGYKHSKWLSFMKKRLEVARNLLNNRGIIFISIDDNEQAQLKVLCDEIFGERNFIANLVWRKKYGGGKGTNFVVDLHEYILVYGKDKSQTEQFQMERPKEKKEIFKLEDEYVEQRGKYYIRPLKSGLAYRKNLIYPIKCPDGSEIETQWICGKDTFEEMLKEDRIVFKKLKTGSYNVYKKFYENDKGGTVFPDSIIYDLAYNQNGKEEIKKIFNVKEGRDVPFSNSKPKELIEHLINFNKNKNAIVLDFFAGSGTTGQAVLELNKKDNGNRQYILCTDNENNICENITYTRMRTVITGLREDSSKYSEGIQSNLKYYKTSHIPRLNNEEENIQENLLVNIRNLIQLENGISIDDKVIKVILNEDEIDKFSENIEQIKECEKLYISSDILLTAKQVKIFKDNNIEVFIIPEYYFDEEIKEVQ